MTSQPVPDPIFSQPLSAGGNLETLLFDQSQIWNRFSRHEAVKSCDFPERWPSGLVQTRVTPLVGPSATDFERKSVWVKRNETCYSMSPRRRLGAAVLAFQLTLKFPCPVNVR